MFASLSNRNFRRVWLGSVTEHLGEFMQLAAILWLVNELTHSTLILTIVGSCRFMPLIIFPIAGGVVADRVDRRRLLIAALLGSTLLSASLVLLTVTRLIIVWHLIIISLLGGITTSFNHPARHGIVPNLVKKEHLLNAIALDSISVQAARMIAMPIAGYVLAFFGAWPIFVLRVLGNLLAVFWLLLANIPPTPATSRTHMPWVNLKEGLCYLQNHSLILGLVLLFLVPRIGHNTYVNFLPVFANDLVHVGAVGYGYLQGAPGLGAIMSLLGITMLTHYRRKFRLLVGAGMALGTFLISFSVSQWLSLSLLLLVFIGAVETVFNVVNSTLIQTATADDFRGRIMSWREVAFGLGPTGSILFGALAQYTGASVSLGSLGAIFIVIFLLLIVFIRLKIFNEITISNVSKQ